MKETLEDKIAKLLKRKLSECRRGEDSLLFIDGDVVSTTKHTGSLESLKLQAKGVAKNLGFKKLNDLKWEKDGKIIEIKPFGGQDSE